MADREKVIRGLECCAANACSECPYHNETECVDALTPDALALLKEMEWIPVTEERLPEEDETVLVYDGEIRVGRIEKGISAEERERMKKGEIPDPVETGWNLSEGYFLMRRSEGYTRCDEAFNNLRPYCWLVENGGVLFGQNVSHWMPSPPKPPKGEDDAEVR